MIVRFLRHGIVRRQGKRRAATQRNRIVVDIDLPVCVRALDAVVVPLTAIRLDAPADRCVLEMMPKSVVKTRRTPNPAIVAVLPVAVLKA